MCVCVRGSTCACIHMFMWMHVCTCICGGQRCPLSWLPRVSHWSEACCFDWGGWLVNPRDPPVSVSHCWDCPALFSQRSSWLTSDAHEPFIDRVSSQAESGRLFMAPSRVHSSSPSFILLMKSFPSFQSGWSKGISAGFWHSQIICFSSKSSFREMLPFLYLSTVFIVNNTYPCWLKQKSNLWKDCSLYKERHTEVGIGLRQHNQRQSPAFWLAGFPSLLPMRSVANSAVAALVCRRKKSLLPLIGSHQLAWVSTIPRAPGRREDWHTPVLIPIGRTTVLSSILNWVFKLSWAPETIGKIATCSLFRLLGLFCLGFGVAIMTFTSGSHHLTQIYYYYN